MSLKKIELIEIERIMENPFQPRKTINKEKIVDLANSISKVGLLQPIIVNINSKNEVRLIVGQRRLEAYKYLNKKNIECIVLIGDASNNDFKQAAIIENIQREDMSDYDLAISIKELKDSGMLLQNIADQLGKSVSWISKILSVLNLNEEIQKEIIEGNLDISKAAVIASVKNMDNNQKSELVKEVINNNMTKQELEKNVKNCILDKAKDKLENVKKPEEIYLENKLDTEVIIEKEKIVIKYFDDEQLKRIFQILGFVNKG